MLTCSQILRVCVARAQVAGQAGDDFLKLRWPGNDLFSRQVAPQLSSTLKHLTSEFGKGSGRTTSLKLPSHLNHKMCKL